MDYQDIFKRYEFKYLLTEEQVIKLKKLMEKYMRGDEYGKTTICNIYYDTPDYLLVRRSLEKPVYKEKLRVRSYGTASENGTVFAELKKKYRGVVYKRRIALTEAVAGEFMKGGADGVQSQIASEIRYALALYKNIAPRVFISYRREAFFAKDDRDLRITLDNSILYRTYDLDLKKGAYGLPVLPGGMYLAEVKTGSALPLWLVDFFAEEHIYKTSFSKYGNAYTDIYNNNKTGGVLYA